MTPNSEATSYSFEWGTTTAYGQSTPNTSAGSSAAAQPVGAQLSGLAPGTTYHVRLTVTNTTGTSTGADRSFTTAGSSAPPMSTTPEPAPPSPPVSTTPEPARPSAPDEKQKPDPSSQPLIGSTAVASVTRGTVSFRVPGRSIPIELRDGATIPSGSVIDTRRGTISLESALDSSGRSQTAKFRGAVFRMTLSRRDAGVVDIHLTQAPTGCPSRRFAARAARASKAPIKLWSQDRKGKYRTHGRNSVAIVRGTEWTTAETCAGTLTRVIKGAVSVSDRRTGKKKLVRAGHAYLARSRR